MKLVPYKHQDHWRYLPIVDFEIEDGVKLAELVNQFKSLKHATANLASLVQNAIVMKKDTTFIAEINGKLTRIKNVKLFEDQPLDFPIEFYTLKNNEIVLDKKKVGAI